MLAIQAEVEERQRTPETIASEVFEEQSRSGNPLLSLGVVKLDSTEVNKTFSRMATLFTEYPEILGPVPQAILSPDYKLLIEDAKEWLAGKNIPQEIGGEAVNPVLLAEIARQTLRPYLIKYSQVLEERHRKESWRRNYCPLCGSEADFSYLEREVGGRFLVCPACCTEWLGQRMECPFCGSTLPW